MTQATPVALGVTLQKARIGAGLRGQGDTQHPEGKIASRSAATRLRGNTGNHEIKEPPSLWQIGGV